MNVSEDWIARNVLYMLLGLETDLFVIHKNGIVTVQSFHYNIACDHISVLCLRNVLKKFANYGTLVNRLRALERVESKPIFVTRFLVKEAQTILKTFDMRIETIVSSHPLNLTKLLNVVRHDIAVIQEFWEFEKKLFTHDFNEDVMNEWKLFQYIVYGCNCEVATRLTEYLSNHMVDFLTSWIDFPVGLRNVRDDVQLIFQSDQANVLRLLNESRDVRELSKLTVDMFRKNIEFEAISELVCRICFLAQGDFCQQFLDTIDGQQVGIFQLQDAFVSAIEQCPSLQRYDARLLKKFWVGQHQGSVYVHMDRDESESVLFTERVMEAIREISILCYAIRMRVWCLNRMWREVSRGKVQGIDVERGKLSLTMNKLLNDIMVCVSKGVETNEEIGVRELCKSYETHILNILENVRSLSKSAKLDTTDQFITRIRSQISYSSNLVT